MSGEVIDFDFCCYFMFYVHEIGTFMPNQGDQKSSSGQTPFPFTL